MCVSRRDRQLSSVAEGGCGRRTFRPRRHHKEARRHSLFLCACVRHGSGESAVIGAGCVVVVAQRSGPMLVSRTFPQELPTWREAVYRGGK